MHARSGQLQGIFGFLKPLIHVWILVWSWSVDKNDPVVITWEREVDGVFGLFHTFLLVNNWWACCFDFDGTVYSVARGCLYSGL